MKVNIGKYKSWFGPYQLAELICFWVPETKDEFGGPQKPEWVHKFGEWLAHGSIQKQSDIGEIVRWTDDRPATKLYRFLTWIHNLRSRKISVKIESHDVWSLDTTLALIILPALRKLQTSKQGAPIVDDDDVPEHIRSTAAPSKANEWDVDGFHFERWDWVLDEIVWTFEQILDDNADMKFVSGNCDIRWKKLENDCSEMVFGPEHTQVTDHEGQANWTKRKQNGLRLFGKYYESLWS